MWIVKEKSEGHLSLEDPEGWYTADVRWDGCIHFRRYFNQPISVQDGADSDYLHICDIDEEIARLQAIKVEALKHFGGWPG